MAISFYNAGDNAIYDSGQHFVPQEKYRLGYTPPAAPEVIAKVPGGITNTNAFTNSGGDNYTGGYNFGNTGFQQAVDARQRNLNKPTDTSTFMGRTMGTVRDFIEPQSASQIMKDGYQEPRFQPGIIGMMMGKLDNYRNLPQADQAFIAQNMGYTGPTVFGENNSGLGKDPFGINTRSAKGNYADYVDKKDLQLTNTLTKKGGKIFDKYAVDPITGQALDEEEFSYNPVTGKYIGTSASAIAKANQMNKMNLTKLGFYKSKKKESEKLRMQEELAKEEAAAQIERAKRGQAPSDPGSRGRDDTPGFGKTAEGNYSNQFEGGDPGLGDPSTGRGREEDDKMAKGGRAGYFFGGRVNYKAGGRTGYFLGGNIEGGYSESQKDSGGKQTTTSYGGDSNNPPASNYDYSKLIDQYKEEPDYTLGNIELNKNLTNNTRLNTILNLQKTVEDKELAGQLELDKRLGPVDTRLTYGTDQKPKLSASYMNYSPTLGGIYANADSSDGLGVNYAYNNIGANADFDNSGKFERAGITYDNNGVALGLDTQDGVTASYSKDIFDGTGQIKAGGRYDPITGEYNAEGKISFPFANGGLAGLI